MPLGWDGASESQAGTKRGVRLRLDACSGRRSPPWSAVQTGSGAFAFNVSIERWEVTL